MSKNEVGSREVAEECAKMAEERAGWMAFIVEPKVSGNLKGLALTIRERFCKGGE